MEKKFVIIDANSVLYRAFFALPFLTTKNKEPVNGIYGFLLVLLKVLKELKPCYLAAAFDVKGPTFRHKQFKNYKAGRAKAPKDLISQIPKLKHLLGILKIPVIEKKGFEADDLIASLDEKLKKEKNIERIILTGDLDIFQIISNSTKVYYLGKGIKNTSLYGRKELEEKYKGIKARNIPDLKALMGDAADNISGVKGIGEKTAIFLIKEFGNLKNLYSNIEKETEKSKKISPKLKNVLKQNKNQAFLCRSLTEIKKDIKIKLNLKDCDFWKNYNQKKVEEILTKFEFFSILKKFLTIYKEKDKPLKIVNQKTLF